MCESLAPLSWRGRLRGFDFWVLPEKRATMETSVFLKNTKQTHTPTKTLLKTWLEGLNFDPSFCFNALRKRINKIWFEFWIKIVVWVSTQNLWQGHGRVQSASKCQVKLFGGSQHHPLQHQNEGATKMERKGIQLFPKVPNNLGTCSMFKFVPTEALSPKAARLEGWCDLLPCYNNAMVHASSFVA